MGGGFTELPLDKGRALIDDEALMGGERPEKVGSAREYRVDGVRVREYRPAGVAMDAKLPTLIYLHGGGWVLGSLDSHDAMARYLCNRVGAAVLSVDYRLAPENPYPAGLDDVLKIIDAAQRGRIDGVDTERIAVGGDSAGGNLTAAACLRLRDEGKPQPVLQVLFVPVTDLTRLDRPSYEEFADGYFLTAEQMRWYIDHYTPDPGMREQPYASPLLAEDLSGLAPAYVAVDGFDPLRDEGEEYARRLTAAGVPTTLRRHGELVHPFVNSLGVWPNARRALDEAVGALRLALQAGGAV